MTEPLAPRRFGPLLYPDGVTFQVWAPGARRVTLWLDPRTARQRTLPMRGDEEGFFSLHVPGAGPGTRYLLQRESKNPAPDPASRFQPDGVHAPSEVVDLAFDDDDGPGLELPAVDRWVIYELHVGTFSPEGTYQGLRARLDHLQRLGINAIELMPLAAFDGRWNWGYDGVLHHAPFAGYGRPAELQQLVQDCHRRGIAVILDVVTNHFGPEGNAMWALAPRFFRPDKPSPWGPGINWAEEAVLRYFDEMVGLWIGEYGFDGLRFDAFQAIPATARRRHLQRMVGRMGQLRRGRPTLALVESDANQSSLLGTTAGVRVAQLNFDLQRAVHALLTGERHHAYGDFAHPAIELSRALRDGFAFAQRHSAFRRRVIGDAPRVLDWASLVNFIQNHDTAGNRYLGQRLDALAGAPALRAATALLLLHPAIPFLFMGQEWGATTRFFFFTDFDEALGRRVTRGRRALFREIDPDRCAERAPGPQQRAALERSRLDWSELERAPHRETLELTRRLLEARARWLPQMGRRTVDVRARCAGRAQVVEIAARSAGTPPFLLVANLNDQPLPLDTASTICFSTADSADPGAVPPLTTELRQRHG